MEASILFFIWRHRSNKGGFAPIYCRITYRQKRYQFSTKLFVKPKSWNSARQIIIRGRDKGVYNQRLHKIKSSLFEAYFQLHERNEVFTAKDIYKFILGEKEPSLLDVYNNFLDQREELTGITLAKSTQKTLKNGYSFLKATLESLEISHLCISELNSAIAKKIELEGNKCGYAKSTMFKYMKLLKQVCRFAFNEGVVKINPMDSYIIKGYTPKISYLDQKELQSIEGLSGIPPNLERIKDCFLFSCYTGLAYNEAKSFRHSDIETMDDMKWIKVNREKTKKEYYVPIISRAEQIINKYKELGKLPLISNQKFNKYIKQIANLAGIKKQCTHHISRKTFATTILLSKGVPMEVVSKLLGHSNINITSSTYAAVNRHLIVNHIKRLE